MRQPKSSSIRIFIGVASSVLATLGLIVTLVVMRASSASADMDTDKGVDPGLLNGLRFNMSEQDVVSRLGHPVRVSKGKFLGKNGGMVRRLHYKLTDGTKYVAFINDRDELVVGGAD